MIKQWKVKFYSKDGVELNILFQVVKTHADNLVNRIDFQGNYKFPYISKRALKTKFKPMYCKTIAIISSFY